jgi:hypothetical protein
MKLLEFRFSGVQLFRQYHVKTTARRGTRKYLVLSHWAITSNARKVEFHAFDSGLISDRSLYTTALNSKKFRALSFSIVAIGETPY